tara:strand:+ start:936 stop:1751 length:816 start_codon:yes stop_codon:yes gene_type:complete
MEPLQFNQLEVRLAETAADIDAAQELRYRVFYEEMGAKPTQKCECLRRDFDPYDEIADHLLVVDRERSRPGRPCVAGTYRLLRGSVADQSAGFYSEGEFDLAGLLDHPGEIMELGRSCIDSTYRKRGAMQLLWRGIAEYISEHKVDIMFGCGSIHGTDAQEAKLTLAYLYHNHLAPKSLRPKALNFRNVKMHTMDKASIDSARALNELPPLLKGYLRLGAYVGEGAVIDHQFNTIDVCVVVETANVTGKYRRHFFKPEVEAGITAHGVAAE